MERKYLIEASIVLFLEIYITNRSTVYIFLSTLTFLYYNLQIKNRSHNVLYDL